MCVDVARQQLRSRLLDEGGAVTDSVSPEIGFLTRRAPPRGRVERGSHDGRETDGRRWRVGVRGSESTFGSGV